METERSSNRILLGSIQSLYVEAVHETDIKITVKEPVEGWNVGQINPQVRVLYSLSPSTPPPKLVTKILYLEVKGTYLVA